MMLRIGILGRAFTQNVSVRANLRARPCAANLVRTGVGKFSEMCVRVCA